MEVPLFFKNKRLLDERQNVNFQSFRINSSIWKCVIFLTHLFIFRSLYMTAHVKPLPPWACFNIKLISPPRIENLFEIMSFWSFSRCIAMTWMSWWKLIYAVDYEVIGPQLKIGISFWSQEKFQLPVGRRQEKWMHAIIISIVEIWNLHPRAFCACTRNGK